MKKELLAADRYAHALFDIARTVHIDHEVEAELENFSAALKGSPALEAFFGNPRLRLEEKRKFLLKLYPKTESQYNEILVNFFTILFEKGRFNLIHEIAVSFKRIADEAQGQATAQVRSAAPLTSSEEASLVQKIEKLAGYKITVKKEVDPSLIGGVWVRVRNRVLDGTVRNKIENLKKELVRIHKI